MLAALATGAVGSVALVRTDISDTLPGVAIAISLVPPLSVVGLTFESGEFGQSLGALLLFLTNVAAILGSGTVVMAIYGVQRLITPEAAPEQRMVNRRHAILIIAAMLVAVTVPLTASSITITRDTSREARALEAARAFGEAVGWTAVEVATRDGMLVIQMEGPLPIPDTDLLQEELEKRSVEPSSARVELEPVRVVDLE